MKKVRAIVLDCNLLLEHPDGTKDEENLEKMVAEVVNRKLSNNLKIRVYRSQRVKDFDPANPDWEDVSYTITVLGLKRIYYKVFGRKYDSDPYLDKML